MFWQDVASDRARNPLKVFKIRGKKSSFMTYENALEIAEAVIILYIYLKWLYKD